MEIPNLVYVKRGALREILSGLQESSKEGCIPVLIIPLYPEEAEAVEMEGHLKFGNSNEIAPWTFRKIQGKLVIPPSH